jgi:hypothetical protein
MNDQRLERYVLQRKPANEGAFPELTAAQRSRMKRKWRSRKTHEHQKGTRCGVCRPNSVKGEMLP